MGFGNLLVLLLLFKSQGKGIAGTGFLQEDAIDLDLSQSLTRPQALDKGHMILSRFRITFRVLSLRLPLGLKHDEPHFRLQPPVYDFGQTFLEDLNFVARQFD